MDTLISLAMIVDHVNSFNMVLTNIRSQSLKNWELFLLIKSKDLISIEPLNDNNIKIVELASDANLANCLLSILPSFKGDLIVILNSSDINHYKRLEIQSSFMKKDKSISICSCLEMPLYNQSNLSRDSDDSNKFIKKDEIDFAVLGGYIPLDVYTFMIRKDFLIPLSNFFPNHNLDTNLDLILFFLNYTAIEKVPEVLYYFKNPRIPYPENIIMDNSLNSLNKISVFNRNKSIEYRTFISEAILKNSDITISNTTIKYTLLVIINNLSVGGTETYILTIVKALRSFGIYTYILTSGGILEDLFLKNHISVLKANFNENQFDNIDYCNTVKHIVEIVNSYNIKLIQFHLPDDIHLASRLNKYLNVPIVLTIHGTFFPKDIIKNNLIYFSKIIFVSSEVQNYYCDIITSNNKSSYSVVPNAIEPSIYKNQNNFIHKLLSLPKDSNIIIYCSRLSPSKAPLAITFLRSFEKIAYTNDNVYALIIGEGSDKILIDSYSQTINSLYSHKKVFVIGAVFNVLDYYSNSTFVIGTGRVALEAMSSSKAVISLGLNNSPNIVTRNNISEIISSNFGDHCSKIPTAAKGIYSETLTNDINYLLNNPLQCKIIGSWGKNYCNENLNIFTSTKYITEIFNNILNIYENNKEE